MKNHIKIAFISLILALGCNEKKEIPIAKAPIYFHSVPADSSGIDFSNDLTYKDDLNIIEYLYYYNGGGVAIGDINNDGLEDIYLTANQTPDKFYLNMGNLKFKDITKAAGIQIDSTWSTGVTMEDVNNDGLLDIYVSKVGKYKSLTAHNQLYINKGNTVFEEVASQYGLDFSGLSTQASFFDYDNDGDMDVYLMNHSFHSQRSYGNISLRQQSDSLAGDRFYENQLNQGIQKFIDVTSASGIYSSALGYGLALATSVVNNDGLIDIYVGNDFHENDYLYINQGDKTFKESNLDFLSHTSRFTMGVDIADLNNDQFLDIFSLDMMPFDHETFLKSGGEDSDKVSLIKKNFGFGTQYARNAMQLNRDNSFFSEVSLMNNSYATDWSWSALIQDYDNDGFNDIFVTNGIFKRPNDLNYINYLSNIDFAEYDQTKQNEIERKLIEEMPTLEIANVVFRNKGNLEFDRFSAESGLVPSYSNGAAYGDLDNDGDLDLVVNNINQSAFLLENKSGAMEENHFITIDLKGDGAFKNPGGAKVSVYAQGETHLKELSVVRGFQSSSTHRLHFGLGKAQKVDSVQIRWLDGKVQTEMGLEIDEQHAITRGTNLKTPALRAKKEIQAFETFPFTHMENSYLDYERETLMPEKLSTEGPALVKADFNGDGLEDLYIGGAKYQSPVFFIKQKDGSYVEDKNSDFTKDILYEDVDAVAFDIENDGDVDLYVMSGGNDTPEGDANLEDRIYINNGNARFGRLKAPLIKTNGGSVSAGDFDGDGYADLFIGNRSIPGGYGLSPYSFILKNNGKGEYNVVQQTRLGMVTDSHRADMNNDGLLDLVVVGDWMPVTILINKGDSTFEDATERMGLLNTYGMWNTITIADLDQNGYNDILAGNAGLNFKWKAGTEKPVKLYLDDYDANGQPDPIIFYDFFGDDVPFAPKDKLAEQLPSLKKKFLNYSEFAKVTTIEELTGKAETDILEIKKITELRSMAFFNQEGNFKSVPLPKEAQMSSIADFEVIGKGKGALILYVGNYLGYTAELGHSDANSGGMLRYEGKDVIRNDMSLPLPKGLNARKITNLGGTLFLVVANNDKSYLIKIPINTNP
ncbi:MAG: RNA-binding protein [Flavobacteriales bacterium]|nr:MAG: RNA-binding protein [Flavobacteriales bacterium]